MIRALVFDFDGLILDTEGPDYRAWQEIFREEGCDLPAEVWCECIGRSADWFDPVAYLEELVGRQLSHDVVNQRQRQRHLELVAAESVLPGVIEYLAEAKRLGLPIGIASSSSRQWVLGHLERLGLTDHWRCIRCWDDVERAKPAPDLYQAVLEQLGVAGSDALAFEDSPNGIVAAKTAGMLCVAVPNMLTKQLDLSRADIHLTSLAEIPLPELLMQLTKQERPTATGARQ